MRDIHLAASGLLSRKVGGKPVRPPLPGFVTEVGRSVAWPVSEGEDRYRRGLYIFLKRTIMYPSLIAFDAPGDGCLVQSPGPHPESDAGTDPAE